MSHNFRNKSAFGKKKSLQTLTLFLVPMIPHLLQPGIPPREEVECQDSSVKNNQKYSYDQTHQARPLRPVKREEKIYAEIGKNGELY